MLKLSRTLTSNDAEKICYTGQTTRHRKAAQAMERSFAQAVDLTCVGCEQPFTANIWLIVDAVERPDLVTQFATDRLNVVQCPHCGTLHPVDAPLLFHNSAAEVLFFSSQEHRAPDDGQEIARELGQFLISRIPVAERRPYLAQAQMVAGRDELRRAVAAEDELSIALRALMVAASAEDIRAVAAAHPVLGTAATLAQLNQYVGRLQQDNHVATADALAQRLKVLQAEQSQPILQLIQALLDAASPQERQSILHSRAQAITSALPEVLAALADQAQRQQLDAVARDLLVIRNEVLAQLGQTP